MKVKTSQKQSFPFRSPHKTDRVEPCIYLVSSAHERPHNYQRNSQQAERSASRNKVMIPNHQKLTSFFNLSRNMSSPKSYSTSSTSDWRRDTEKRREKVRDKVQLVNNKLNRDYFDENTEKEIGLIGDRNLGDLRNLQAQRMKDSKRKHHQQIKAYKSETFLRNPYQRHGKQQNIKGIPKNFFPKPFEKIYFARQKSMKKQGQNKMPTFSSKLNRLRGKQLQYTFGYN